MNAPDQVGTISRKAHVVIRELCVEKWQDSESTEQEANGTEVGRQIGARCGLFIVPKIIRVSQIDGLIVFDRVLGAKSLRNTLPAHSEPILLVRRCAEALAAIHNFKQEKLNCEGGVHGDFTIDNLMYVTLADELVVIDWSIPIWLRGQGKPDRYRDLCMFVLSLFNRPVFYPNRVKNAQKLALEFIETYMRCAEFDPRQFFTVSTETLSIYLPHYRRVILWRFLANYPSMVRFRRFLEKYRH